MPTAPHPLQDYIQKINDPRRDIIMAIYQRYHWQFHYAPGATHNHQAWPGGYADHIADTLAISEAYANADKALLATTGADLGYSPDSASIALFLHDIEKPFKYGPSDCGESNAWRERFAALQSWELVKKEILQKLCAEFGLVLTNDEINALHYTHGEGSDYNGKMRRQTPLAAHVHICDTASARKFPHLHVTKQR